MRVVGSQHGPVLNDDIPSGHRLIGNPDIRIAATALHHDLTLLSGNRALVERIPSLKLCSAQEAE